jgi:hypothetical protein
VGQYLVLTYSAAVARLIGRDRHGSHHENLREERRKASSIERAQATRRSKKDEI